MKKFLVALILWLAAVAQADELQGVRANVELVSGAKQSAQFLGIQQDTVSLGGIIQGKFTIIKIAKNRFKSIVDEAGNDLLNAAAPDSAAVDAAADSAKADSVTTDSSNVADDSTMVRSADTTAAEPADPQVTAFLNSLDGKHVFIALESRSIDEQLANQLNNLMTRLLQEAGIPITFAKRTDFGYCREAACIKDSLSHYGAADLYNGRIIASKATDSVIVMMTHTFLQDSTQKETEAQMSLPTMNAISNAIAKDKLKNFLSALLGEEPPKPAQKKSYIHVETDPEGVTLATEAQGEICRSPCTFATQDSGKVILFAYWNVDKQLWGARQAIVPIPFDTTKISIKLKRMRPELRITTTPGDAEIYAGSAPVTLNSKPIGKTPNKYPIYEPGETTVQIRKQGFRDTTVTLFVPPSELTDLNIDLEPIRNVDDLKLQEDWFKHRQRKQVGYAIMGSSAAPLLIGGLFTMLANNDYDKALEIKHELNRPVSSGGEHYQERIKENHSLVDSGKRKMAIGCSLIGLGIAMLGGGFVLSF